MILGVTIPVSIPVTNDIMAKTPNCVYTLKSTSEDMVIFCQKLMKQYYSDDGSVKDMFSAAVNIDTVNSRGLGIAIEYESNGETYWHSGINPGFQSLFVLYPWQNIENIKVVIQELKVLSGEAREIVRIIIA